MNKQKLGFNDIEVNINDVRASEKAIPLNSVNTNNIVISYKVKHNDGSYILLVIYMMMM